MRNITPKHISNMEMRISKRIHEIYDAVSQGKEPEKNLKDLEEEIVAEFTEYMVTFEKGLVVKKVEKMARNIVQDAIKSFVDAAQGEKI